MRASENGYLDCICTLLENQADVNARSNVRNQMMMVMIMMMMIVINDEDRDDYR
jgi:ankyrin repeat protein